MKTDGRPILQAAAILGLIASLGGCHTLAASSAGVAPSAMDLRPLHQWWSADRKDYWVTATEQGNKVAPEIFHYGDAGIEGYVASTKVAGSLALHLYWNEALSDNRNVASASSISEALAAGYELKATEGYVLAERQSGTLPLNLYWNPETTDSATAASPARQEALIASGFRFVRTEGYVWPANGM